VEAQHIQEGQINSGRNQLFDTSVASDLLDALFREIGTDSILEVAIMYKVQYQCARAAKPSSKS
jgi:hypothetical protein